MNEPALPAEIEIDGRGKTFASGLLLDLIAGLRRVPQGALIALTGERTIADDLEAWARLTGHAIVGRTDAGDATRWVIRHGAAPAAAGEEADRPVGSRLWLYTNFDCNLRCDYCCVRSSPTAPRRELGLERVRRIAREAPPLGVRDIFITGGEPFLLPDIAEIVTACAGAANTTVLTNGMLFRGSRLEALRAIPRSVTLQISLDSPTAALHDAHRGRGSWARALEGIEIARTEGFRVRLAATVASEEDADRFRAFLDARAIAEADRVIRPMVMRGFATRGIALSRMDLVPEITITAEGLYWHPVGAEDTDLLVTREIFPLGAAFEAARAAAAREREHGARLATIFHCA